MQNKLKKLINIFKIFGVNYFFKLLLNRINPAEISNREESRIKSFIEQQPKVNPGKKQILFIISWMVFGGADKVNLDIVSHINQDEFEFHFITNIKVKHIWDYRYRKFSNHIYHLDELMPPYLFTTFVQEYIEVNKIDTILASNTTLGYEALPFIKERFKNIKILDLLHGEGGAKESGGYPKFSAQYDKYIDTRIVIDEYLKNHIVTKYHVDPEKIKVIYNGIDIEEFTSKLTQKNKYRTLYNIDEGDLLAVYVGRLSYEKHPEKVIEIAHQLVNKNKIKNIKFIIVGDGEMKDELIDQVKRLELEEYVKVIGYVDDTTNLYNDADVLLVLSEMEGLPIVILEAMAMSTSVIATKVGGIPEMIKDGENGYLIAYTDSMVNEFASKLNLLQKDRDLLGKLGKAGKLIVEEKFSIETMIREYEKLLS